MTEQVPVESGILTEALKVTNNADKQQVVEEALKVLIQIRRQQPIRQLRGRLRWEGNLDEMRAD
jgi:hypothetical protein